MPRGRGYTPGTIPRPWRSSAVERRERTGARVRRARLRAMALAAVAAGAVAVVAPADAAAQPPAAASEPGSELAIYLVTMGPGDAVWERFGHNALWVHDAATGQDLAYNYGMFDFDEPGYLRNFIRG